jgi:hypothetical protein
MYAYIDETAGWSDGAGLNLGRILEEYWSSGEYVGLDTGVLSCSAKPIINEPVLYTGVDWTWSHKNFVGNEVVIRESDINWEHYGDFVEGISSVNMGSAGVVRGVTGVDFEVDWTRNLMFVGPDGEFFMTNWI